MQLSISCFISKMRNISKLIGWNILHGSGATLKLSMKFYTQESEAGDKKLWNLYLKKTYLYLYVWSKSTFNSSKIIQ